MTTKINLRGAAPFKQPSKRGSGYSQPPLHWGGSISPMRLDLLKAFGPVPAIITVRKRKRGDGFPLMRVTAYPNHPFIFNHHFVPVFASILKSFINVIFPPTPATTKAKPFMPLPPRRRWKALSLRDCPGDKRLSWAADPSVPHLNPRHRCRPPAGGADQQISLHHQARDTLQGDEGN
jgi:hypothetical protein